MPTAARSRGLHRTHLGAACATSSTTTAGAPRSARVCQERPEPCYTALHPTQVANLGTLTTPVDFTPPDNLLSRWCRARHRAPHAQRQLPASAQRTVPLAHAVSLHSTSTCAPPQRRSALVEDFCAWRDGFSTAPQAAVALAQFVRCSISENRLARGRCGSVAQRPGRDPHRVNLLRARGSHRPAGCLGPCSATSARRLHRFASTPAHRQYVSPKARTRSRSALSPAGRNAFLICLAPGLVSAPDITTDSIGSPAT